MRRALAAGDASPLHLHFDVAVLDRYREAPGFSVIRTDTVGRVSKEGGWALDFGIAPDEDAIHVQAADLLRLPEPEREHWAMHGVTLPSSRMFLQMRLAPGSCFDDGEVRPWSNAHRHRNARSGDRTAASSRSLRVDTTSKAAPAVDDRSWQTGRSIGEPETRGSGGRCRTTAPVARLDCSRLTATVPSYSSSTGELGARLASSPALMPFDPHAELRQQRWRPTGHSHKSACSGPRALRTSSGVTPLSSPRHSSITGFGTLNLALHSRAGPDYANATSQAVMRHLGMSLERNPLPDPPWFQFVGVLHNTVSNDPQPAPSR